MNANAQTASYGRNKVLLVDDQAMVAEAIRRCLGGEANLEFHYCSDPAKAIEMANAIGPSVILQDLVMPGIDGLTVVEQFRANPATKETPIIVLSTKEEPVIKARAFEVGANDYIVKLPDKIELLARIRYHSKVHQAQVQLVESNQQLAALNAKLEDSNRELTRSLAEVKKLSGMLPICAGCKKIRDDSGYWTQVETYIMQRTLASFSHGVCPTCAIKMLEEAGCEVPDEMRKSALHNQEPGTKR